MPRRCRTADVLESGDVEPNDRLDSACRYRFRMAYIPHTVLALVEPAVQATAARLFV